MVKSGITRRIDELGRIVIPKEIRRNLKIQDCDELDISLDGNNIVLNKHEINNDDKIINLFIYIVSKYLKKNVLFTSKDKIIRYSLINKEKIDKLELNDNIKEIINLRNKTEYYNKFNYIINPLIINGDLFGSIIIYSEDDIKEKDNQILDFSKIFLENYLE